MKTELILNSDILDIIFENRNKAYGAYNLRKFYDNRLIKSLGVMLVIVVVLSAFTFMPNKKEKPNEFEYITTQANIPQPDKKLETKARKEEFKVVQKPATTRIFPSNIVIEKDTSKVDKINAIQTNTEIGGKNVDEPGGDTPVNDNTIDGAVGKGKITDVEPAIDINIPLETAEVMPSYPGGMEALRKFLERNLTNPRDLDEGEEISVKMRFVVGFNGKIQSFTTIQDGGQEFNNEVIRVLKKMPVWIPGKSKGQNVSVYYTIPVKFVISE